MSRPPELTQRERDVLVALCRPILRGRAFTEPASIRDIAETLQVTEAAVKQHLLHLYDKFGIFEGGERRRVRLANDALATAAIDRDTLGGKRPTAEAPARVGVRDPADWVEAGHAAMRRRAWKEAYECLSQADASGAELSAEVLEALGEAAIWAGAHAESITARQRAYAIHAHHGDDARAAAVALSLVINHAIRLNFSVAAGWFAKAKRHLDGQSEGPAHGYLAATAALFLLFEGKLDAAIESARSACASAERYHDADLRALGHAFQGYALARTGRWSEGVSLLDDAMASATSGELGPLATGLVYCRTLCACLESFDYRRALEWAHAISQASADPCAEGFPGDCRTHRAHLLMLKGDWAKAEEEALAACAESETFDLAHAGLAMYEIGMLRLRKGDYEEAAEAFGRANELGVAPQPGAALLHLARLEADAAGTSIRTALSEVPDDRLKRARLLPAQVEIALAQRDLPNARHAAEELEAIARAFPATAVWAAAEAANGAVLLAEGRHQDAALHLRQALHLWLEADSPFDAACTRLELAIALQEMGDDATARMQLETARLTFTKLGASPYVRRVDMLVCRDGKL